MSRCAAGRDVDAADSQGWTPLHWAAAKGDRQRVEQLLEAGANLEARTRELGQAPLHLAAAAGHAGLLPLLITPTTLDTQDNNNHTALQLALMGRWWEAASALVTAGASPRSDQFADSPLLLACKAIFWKGCADVCLRLFNGMQADTSLAGLVEEAVRWRGEHGFTLLHRGAACGYTGLVAKLVEAGADRDAEDESGATPLWAAAAAGHAALVPLLATPGNINRTAGFNRRTPLHAAAVRDGEHTVAALLASGASVDILDRFNHSPLHWAAQHGLTKVVVLLLAALQKQCEQQTEQQKQQQQQQRPARLVEVVAALLVQLSKEPEGAPRCAQVLGVVLDVLGPEVAGQVCQAVQQQLEPVRWLAEALLLGLMGAVERLHAARQPVLARLQRLVVPEGADEQQQSSQHQQQQQQREESTGPLVDVVQKPGQQKVWLVKDAALAAAGGQEQEVIHLLGEFAALQQQQRGLPQLGQPQAQPSQQQLRHTDAVSLQPLVHEALRQAAGAPEPGTGYKAALLAPPGKPKSPAEVALYGPAVYTTLLAAWVAARRQLQQLPQAVVAAVLAAVKLAQQQQQQQQQQGHSALLQRSGGIGAFEEGLSVQLSGLLVEEGGAANAPAFS